MSFEMKENSYLCSQITEGAGNIFPIHVDIRRTGGRGSDLLFEAVLKEYLQFPCEYFLLFFIRSGVTVVNFALQTTPEEKNSGERAGQKPLLIILSPKTSGKAGIDILAVWTVAESCTHEPRCSP
jgi:hypothetical protein